MTDTPELNDVLAATVDAMQDIADTQADIEERLRLLEQQLTRVEAACDRVDRWVEEAAGGLDCEATIDGDDLEAIERGLAELKAAVEKIGQR